MHDADSGLEFKGTSILSKMQKCPNGHLPVKKFHKLFENHQSPIRNHLYELIVIETNHSVHYMYYDLW